MHQELFVWTSRALFDNAPKLTTTARAYRPPLWQDLYSIDDARGRILRVLAEAADPTPMQRVMPLGDIAE